MAHAHTWPIMQISHTVNVDSITFYIKIMTNQTAISVKLNNNILEDLNLLSKEF